MYSKTYYIYGKHASISAIKNPNRKIKKVYITQELYMIYSKYLHEFDYKIVTKKILDNISCVSHQGIIVEVYPLKRNIDFNITNKTNKQRQIIVVLDHITDSLNLGSIMRSCAFFGVEAIIIHKHNSCINENGLIAKAASGALEKIPLIIVNNISNTLIKLQNDNFFVIGLCAHGEQNIEDNIKKKIVIVMGSEDRGIRRLVKEKCDALVKINGIDDNNNDIDSLNVSHATSIVLYSLIKR